jgi:hypothetical protein
MKILCCGCSFTYGDELDNLNDAWPHQLGKMMGATVINNGKPGSSNRQIFHQVIRGVEEHNPDWVFVQWSLLYRTEHSDEEMEYVVWPGKQWKGNPKIHWLEHVKWVTAYNNPKWFSEQYHYVTVLLDHYLSARNIPFVSVDFDAFDPNMKLFYENLSKDNYLKPEQYFVFQNKFENICAWTFPHPKAPKQHPLVEGHEAIAKKYYEHYRNLSRIS